MLKGIDISNWQGGIDLPAVINSNSLDFVIAKATESLDYVDKYCDKNIQSCISNDTLWGYYHFAGRNDGAAEAEYFVWNTTGYTGKGIPVLDIEDAAIPNWTTYVDKFCDRFHSMTNIWPMIYTSASFIPWIKDSRASKHCALWIAGYPKSYKYFEDIKMPYSTSPWDTWTLWQFTSSGRLKGYNGNLDLNYGNLTKEGWLKIASGGNNTADNNGSGTSDIAVSDTALDDAITVLAKAVITGKFGVGEERKKSIYQVIQDRVNEIWNG